VTTNEPTDNLSPLYRRSATRSACPSAERLAALAAGHAWPWQRRRVVAHLAGCADCADDFRALLLARPGLQSALADAGAESARVSPTVRAGGALLAAAVGVLALGVVLFDGRSAPAPEPGVLFASQFEPRPGSESAASKDDQLFGSDFGDKHALRDG
jgi:hypothetical protein